MSMQKHTLALALGLSLVAPAVGQTSVGHYRYSLSLRAQDNTYAQEVPANVSGQRYDVETDAAGRITRVTAVRDGSVETRTVYRFSPGKPAAVGYEWFNGDEPSGRVEIQRDAQGNRTREDYFTSAGTATSYSTYAYSGDSVEEQDCTPEGKLKSAADYSYSSTGKLISKVAYSNPADKTSHVDTEYDPNTGMVRTRKQFKNGALLNTRSVSYNSNGDLLREDVYNPSGTPYAMREYSGGLETHRAYKSGDTTLQEFRYTYDEKRQLKQTDLYYKGAYICHFMYDRLSDGTVKRTLATGPDGALWAEYPDMTITDIKQDGSPINGKSATIHHTGNWF